MRTCFLSQFGRGFQIQATSSSGGCFPSRHFISDAKHARNVPSNPKEVVRPELSDSQRKNIKSCCAIELSFNCVSFAKLRLDPRIPERIVLDAWDSFPLKFPTGKEFKPHLCMTALAPILPRLISTVFPEAEPVSLSSTAIVVGTFPLIRSSALTYSGTLGYLLGCLHRACIDRLAPSVPSLPVFTVHAGVRRQRLSAWKPCVTKYEPQHSLDCLQSLLAALPQLHLDPEPETRLRFAQFLTQQRFTSHSGPNSLAPLPPQQNQQQAYVQHEQWIVHYHQLLSASLLADAYLFLTEGVLQS